MKRWSVAAVGLAAYGLAALISAPATLIDAGLTRISDGRLRLVATQGTLWSGSGQIEMRDLPGRSLFAKSLAWRVLPESLLRGHLVCDVELGQPAKSFAVTISPFRIALENADIGLPATALGLVVPRLAPLGLGGDLLLHVDSLSVEREQTRGKLALQWHDAASVLTPIAPLGDYELNVDGEDAIVHGLLTTLRGPLQLDGKASWNRGDDADFPVTARVPPQYLQQLGPLLQLVAVERSPGTFELQLK